MTVKNALQISQNKITYLITKKDTKIDGGLFFVIINAEKGS